MFLYSIQNRSAPAPHLFVSPICCKHRQGAVGIPIRKSEQSYYSAGEEEEVSLTKEKVKWLMPPGVRGTAVSESEDYAGDSSEEEEDEEEALLRRSRRRGRAEGRRSGRLARQRSPSDPPVCSRHKLLCAADGALADCS